MSMHSELIMTEHIQTFKQRTLAAQGMLSLEQAKVILDMAQSQANEGNVL